MRNKTLTGEEYKRRCGALIKVAVDSCFNDKKAEKLMDYLGHCTTARTHALEEVINYGIEKYKL